ncbi:Na+/H+ antiporter NhaA [Aestuariivirga sp.]|uniref:Na+/H+ antiporter NhaA n=1 Tax=Aestuariivirga sp. TaxID=2650926 RepID=UPI0039E6E0D3
MQRHIHASSHGLIDSTVRRFLASEASAGLLLMFSAACALVWANSPYADLYFSALHTSLGPLSLQHWINDGLMALFFLMVGLEIKREMIDGGLSSWPKRLLPGAAALAGMLVPALVFSVFNLADPAARAGWAIPAATDIAFALGILALLGSRVPVSLKLFLTALAIIDDLGVVLVIAAFYSHGFSLAALCVAALVMAVLVVLNLRGVSILWPYLALGLLLWALVLMSGVHSTIAGVLLALTIPVNRTPASPEAAPAHSPLHRLERALHLPVASLVLPIFGLANAGLSFENVTLASFLSPLTLGVAAGLLVGKFVGIFGAVILLVRLGPADLPTHATWRQTAAVSLICGVGFTMSLFICQLAFEDETLQTQAKLGILTGSALAGMLGYLLLRFTPVRRAEAGEVPH